MIVDHMDDGTTTTVVAQDPENPQYGSIRLVFSAQPNRTCANGLSVTITGAEDDPVILGQYAF